MQRKHGRIGGWLLVAAVAMAVGSAACEEEEPSEIVSFTDSSGRSCTVDLHDISGTAICDADAAPLVSCEAGQEAAFSLGPSFDRDTMISTLQNCAACVDRAEMMTFVASETCANVECAVDMDCPYNGYSCSAGGRCTQ